MEVALPASTDGAKKNELQEITVHAESGGHSIGDVKLRVELRKRSLPESVIVRRKSELNATSPECQRFRIFWRVRIPWLPKLNPAT